MTLEDLWPLYDPINEIVSTLDQQELLPLIVRTAAEVMDMKACTLSLLDETGSSLRRVAAHGLSNQCFQNRAAPVEKTRADTEALAGQPVIILDVSNNEAFHGREDAEKEGVCSGLYVPLKAVDGTVGVITVYSPTPHLFTEGETKLLCILASHAAMVIQSARLRDHIQTECDLLARDIAAWQDSGEHSQALAKAIPARCSKVVGNVGEARTELITTPKATDGSVRRGAGASESRESPQWVPSRLHWQPRGCSECEQRRLAWASRHVSHGSPG